MLRVNGDPRPQARILKHAGDAQQGVVGTALAEPLVARVEDNAGQPVAGVAVSFAVLRSNGVLDGGVRRLTVLSDTDGLAAARLVLGSRAGAGTDQVTATAPGFLGTAAFSANARPAADVRRLAAVEGANQRGASSSLLPDPLVVLLTDGDGNPVSGEIVSFEVLLGRGRVDNDVAADVLTDADGRAAVLWALGLHVGVNAQLVEARAGNETVSFVASAAEPGPVAFTALSGFVFDNRNDPIVGAAVSLPGDALQTVTDTDGRFILTGVSPGRAGLEIDGGTGGAFPALALEVNLLRGIDNSLDRPIYLPRLDDEGRATVGPDRTVVITRADTPGLEMTIAAGSARFADGSERGEVQIVRVDRDRVPMLPPDGNPPRIALSIQPPGVSFDPPARIRFPNTEGHPAGRILTLVSYDHEIGAFVPIAALRVTEDGAFVTSEEGQGVVQGGWHCVPPDPVRRTCCEGVCQRIWCADRADPNDEAAEPECKRCSKRFGRGRCDSPDDDSCLDLLPGEPLYQEILSAGTPDCDCYKICPSNSVCRNGTCQGGQGDSMPEGSTCTRRFDPIFCRDGESGTCHEQSDGLMVCCPDGLWDGVTCALTSLCI